MQISNIKFKSKVSKNFVIGILAFGTLFVICNLAFGISRVSAQVPPPTVACTDTSDPGPEFNSLRPYQASPCQSTLSSTAKYCGNNLTIHDTITETYPGNGTCTVSAGKATCKYNETVSKNIVIDLSVASLPIMGNTEDVVNSQSNTESLTEAEKMNGYVSWYLNGVLNRAEDGSSKNTENIEVNAVNFSGPINKLLPSVMLDAQRVESINNAKVTNHNQIVACGKRSIPIIGSLLNIGTFEPQECYEGDGSNAKGEIFRLTSWNGDLSFWNTVTNQIVDNMTAFLPNVLREDIVNSVADHWNKRIPPLPWSDANGKPFATEELYQKAYNEWKGKTCAIIPVINKVVCFENILVPNTYANLYSYIPLSSTEDLKGSVSIDSVSSSSGSSADGTSVSNVSFSNQSPSTLFFPHMQESTELAGLLQNTFVAESEQENKIASPTDISTGISCNEVEVRSNKGDKLFATQLSGNLNYNVSFTCTFNLAGKCSKQGGSCIDPEYCCPGYDCKDRNTCVLSPNPGVIPTAAPVSTQTCTKDIYVNLSTTSNTPKADDIWSQTVAGPQSIFKRMFPKTNVEGGVGQIIDIPGSTSITYSGSGVSQQNTDLKFPHIGGISEYFLKGIQTALRPKGYGEPITFAPVTNVATGKVDCDQSAPEIKLPYTISKEALNQRALNRSGEGNHILECYNDVVRKSLAAGISPAYTLFLWFNESGGSNYNISVQDFGINSTSVVGFTAQINSFLEKPSAYKLNYPECFGKGDDTAAFWAIYLTGHCTPDAGKPYTDLFTVLWSSVSQCPIPKYPFGASCY